MDVRFGRFVIAIVCGLAGSLALAVSVSADAVETAPIQAIVGVEGATVRCGPGREYYQTGRLASGTRVEIWRHDSDGWLAIRPPGGSFSLVKAADLELIPGTDMAQVTRNEAVAWVGSDLPITSLKWQVRLDPGERVIVLGRLRRALIEGQSEHDVYRIAPPSGEFRWVHESDLAEVPTDVPQADRQVKLADYQIVVDDGSSSDQHQRQRIAFTPRRDRDPARDDRNQSPIRPLRQNGSTTRTASFDTAYRQVEVALSETVLLPARQWQLDTLLDQVDSLLERAETTWERGRVERLKDEIAAFDRLKKRFLALAADTEVGESNGQATASMLPAGTSRPSTFPEVTPRFDGTGWLLPVHSGSRSAPPYALLDSEGRILQFVSPSPGLNLHRYLKKRVGIFGQRSYLAELEKPHLTAHRVVQLDRHVR